MRDILLVEDDVDQSLALENRLSRSGYRVDAAFDGEEAIDKGLRHRHDLILLDLGLPQVEGRWVLRRLRASRDTATVPIVVVTAETDPEVIDQARKLGVVDIVHKPARLSEIMTAVEAALDRRDREAAGRFWAHAAWIAAAFLAFYLIFIRSTGNGTGFSAPAAPRSSPSPMEKGDYPAPAPGVYRASLHGPSQWVAGVMNPQETVAIR